MRRAEARLQTAGKRLVGEQRIEMHRRFGNADILCPCRDAAMQIGQRLAIIEPRDLGEEPFEQPEQTVGAIGKAIAQFARVHALVRLAFVEPAFGARAVFGGRKPHECKEIAAFEMRAFLGELRRALALDEGGRRIRIVAVRIAQRGTTHGLDEDGPARSQPAQRAV